MANNRDPSSFQAPISGPAWDVGSEYPSADCEAVEADLADAVVCLDGMADLNPALADSPATGQVAIAQRIFKLSLRAGELLGNLSTFAECMLSTDGADAGALVLQGRLLEVQRRHGELGEPLIEFVSFAEQRLIDQYLSDPDAGASAFEVGRIRDRAHARLPLAEEQLAGSLARDGLLAWSRMYTQLTSTMVCRVRDGDTVAEMGVARASGRLLDADETVRREAWAAINGAFEMHSAACGAAINAMAGWRLQLCARRSRTRAVDFLDAPVHASRIQRNTLDQLMAVVGEARPVAQRAAGLQARMYGKTAVGPWDVRAPAPRRDIDHDGLQVPFDDAMDLVADAYGGVHRDLAQFVRMMSGNRWIEATTGPRKRPGAYCTRFPLSGTPRVYMTYTGGIGNVITLAHELGHAFHGWVLRDLPPSQRRYGMSLAETASTFGETVVRDALAAQAGSASQRLDIAWEEIAAIVTFLLNIPVRFEFENALYRARTQRPLQIDELRDLMGRAWQTWYGDSLSEPDEWFWASKLHFFIGEVSFYNFPYLFGYLFSLSVVGQRSRLGADFFPWYVEMLRDTGRMTAEELASKHLAADIGQPGFWREVVAGLSDRVDAFAALLDQVD